MNEDGEAAPSFFFCSHTLDNFHIVSGVLDRNNECNIFEAVSSSSKITDGAWITFDCHEEPVFVPADNWVGFDLDGTLARTDNPGHFEPPYPIGDPIPETVTLVQQLLAAGVKVKIFTARACESENIAIVQQWTEKHGLGRLEVTNQKDYNMIRYYDDRAIQMQLNSGKSIAAIWSARTADLRVRI